MNDLNGFQFLRWKSFCEILKHYLFKKWFRKRKKRTPNLINNVRLGGTDRRYRKNIMDRNKRYRRRKRWLL